MNTNEFNALVDRVTEKVIKKLTERIQSRSLYLLGDNPGLLSTKQLNDFKRSVKNKDKLIIVTELSFENLVNICQFRPQSELEETIVDAIKAGQRFLILKEGRSYLSLLGSGKYALKERILSFESELYRYGGDFVSINESIESFSFRNDVTPYENQQTKKFLTAKELMEQQLPFGSTLYLSNQCSLTDQATEYIQEKKINISWTNEK
ncbi:hypothetical protein [Enterococcus wangshanyuanii]|uniref:Ethanolamine utilization protein n=1 Tax=Enterococcus wangshanyuanii TaxID=2005703 RepID=A0ABQ1NT53_9ENTE|nr:hypothetical protein [Enterococcus wangshanyuanii]GGC84739.1 hypothetical protein GCM10011573_12980 [Enterococcus wangshanyuanii]